jgi:hypothetical protein
MMYITSEHSCRARTSENLYMKRLHVDELVYADNFAWGKK